jgi:hypothetical protein
MKIYIRNNAGMVKQVKLGFSWTMLFFGIFVPLFRGDLKWTILSLILVFITSGFAWLILPFFYNRMYVKSLLESGWYPADEMSKNALLAKGFMFYR